MFCCHVSLLEGTTFYSIIGWLLINLPLNENSTWKSEGIYIYCLCITFSLGHAEALVQSG